MLNEIENYILSNEKNIIQFYGWNSQCNLTLLMLANYYITVGKIVLYLNYGKINIPNIIKRYKFNALKDDKFILIKGPSMDKFIDGVANMNIDDNNIVIMIDSMNILYATETMSTSKVMMLHETNVKKLNILSNKVFFSSSVIYVPNKKSVNSVNINVDYKMMVNDISVEGNEDFFKTMKRKSIISSIID